MPFEKGKSGNPGGRPKVIGEVQALARQYTTEAIETLRDIMRDKKAPAAKPQPEKRQCLRDLALTSFSTGSHRL
jgi:hypothetical protein